MEFDVCIVGAGTVGTALALGLHNHTQLKVAVIEQTPFDSNAKHPGFDARSVALAGHSCDILHALGLNNIAELGAAIEHIHVSDKGHLGHTTLHARESSRSYFGRVIELHSLGNALHDITDTLDPKRVVYFSPDSVSHISTAQKSVSLTLDSGNTLSTALLVAADGTFSATKSMLNCQDTVVDYAQAAIISNVMTSQPHDGWAYERFTQEGPLAMLPLPSRGQSQPHRYSVVWTVDEARAPDMLSWTDETFCQQLQQVFGYRKGRILQAGQRVSYPLALRSVTSDSDPRIVFIGNAKQTLHPIAGQGLNLALRDVHALIQALRDGVEPQTLVSTITQYKQHRQSDQRSIMSATNALVSIFSNDYWPLLVGRNAGLLGLQAMPSLKRWVATKAMGY